MLRNRKRSAGTGQETALSEDEKLDQRIQLVASASFGKDVDDWRRTQAVTTLVPTPTR